MGAHVNKRWSVNAISSGQEPVKIFRDGWPLTQTALATIENVSSVEHLLIAVAEDARFLCTVANSIQGTPTISVSARSLAPESVSSGR